MRNKQVAELSFDLKAIENEKRLQKLEQAVYKTKMRNRATAAQRFLLCYYLGFIDLIRQNSKLPQKHKDLIVSEMLDIDPDNARKFLSELGKGKKPLLNTEANYKFLADFFKEIGYSEQEKKVGTVLLSILNKKGK